MAFAQNTRDEVRLMDGDGSLVGALAAQPGMKQTTYVAQAVKPICYAIMPQNSGKDFKAKISNVAQPLMAGGPVGGNQGGDYIVEPIPLQEVGKRTGVSTTDVRAGVGIGQQNDPMFTLQAHAQHGVAQPISFHPTQDPISSQDGVSHAMSNGSKGGTATATVAVCATGETTHALTSSAGRYASEDGTGRGVPRAAHLAPMQIRRLQPTECETLQGFPRNWTAEACLPDGTIKPQADGPRYKQLGNAVTVNVAEWIAKRLAATLHH